MDKNDIMMMKFLRKIKNKYYPNSPTYFDEDLKELERKYNEVKDNCNTKLQK